MEKNITRFKKKQTKNQIKAKQNKTKNKNKNNNTSPYQMSQSCKHPDYQ